MKTDKELIEIFKRHNHSTRYYWAFNTLTSEEKERLFELLNHVKQKTMEIKI